MNREKGWREQCALVLSRDDVQSILNAGQAPSGMGEVASWAALGMAGSAVYGTGANPLLANPMLAGLSYDALMLQNQLTSNLLQSSLMQAIQPTFLQQAQAQAQAAQMAQLLQSGQLFGPHSLLSGLQPSLPPNSNHSMSFGHFPSPSLPNLPYPSPPASLSSPLPPPNDPMAASLPMAGNGLSNAPQLTVPSAPVAARTPATAPDRELSPRHRDRALKSSLRQLALSASSSDSEASSHSPSGASAHRLSPKPKGTKRSRAKRARAKRSPPRRPPPSFQEAMGHRVLAQNLPAALALPGPPGEKHRSARRPPSASPPRPSPSPRLAQQIDDPLPDARSAERPLPVYRPSPSPRRPGRSGSRPPRSRTRSQSQSLSLSLSLPDPLERAGKPKPRRSPSAEAAAPKRAKKDRSAKAPPSFQDALRDKVVAANLDRRASPARRRRRSRSSSPR